MSNWNEEKIIPDCEIPEKFFRFVVFIKFSDMKLRSTDFYSFIFADSFNFFLFRNIVDLIISALLIQLSHQLYENDPYIVTLTSSNFDEQVATSNSFWIVEFYSHKCPHCISLVPEFQKLSQSVSNKYRVGAINCLREKEICKEYDVTAFPKIAFLRQNYVVEYNGPNDSISISLEAENADRDLEDFFTALSKPKKRKRVRTTPRTWFVVDNEYWRKAVLLMSYRGIKQSTKVLMSVNK